MSCRNSSIDLLPQNYRRQFSNWFDASSEQSRDNRDENSFLRRQSRVFNKDRSAESSTSRSDHLKSQFECVNSAQRDDLMLNGNLCFHQTCSTLDNNRVSNHHGDNSKISSNSSNSQLNMNTAALSSSHSSLVTEYASWYCAEEQQQIVNMLRDVNYRHERQLRRDILTAKNDQMSLDGSSSSNFDPNSSGSQHQSYSSDEEDGITVLVSPGDHPLNDVIDPDIHLTKDLIEKSTSDYFEEFQNIFTTSPEKTIINTLVKECFRGQTGKSAAQEKPVSSECTASFTQKGVVGDQFNNNVIEVEVGNASDLSASTENYETKGSPDSNIAEVKQYVYPDVCEKIRPLSKTRQLPRCFEPGIEPSSSNKVAASEIPKDTLPAVFSRSCGISEKVVQPKYGSVIEGKGVTVKFQMCSSTDQIPLTDHHRMRIQKQKYDFDCKFNKNYDPKLYFKPPSQSNISAAASSWKPLQQPYSSAPSGQSFNDLRNLFYNHQKMMYENVKKVACIPIQTAQNQMQRDMQNKPFYKVPYYNIRQEQDSSTRLTRINFPSTSYSSDNMVQSDSCLLKNLRLPQDDYQKASMSESNLLIKSSKDLDRIYKRISLEELFVSDKDLKPHELEAKLDIPCSSARVESRFDSKLRSFVSPSDHLKQILNIGSNDIHTSINASQKNECTEFNDLMPLKTDAIKTRISTACQTESCIETASKTFEKPKSKFKVSVENTKSVFKDFISSVTDCDTKKISDPQALNKINMQNTSEEISKLKNEAEILGEDISSTGQPNDPIQLSKDIEKGLLYKKGNRKKVKSNRNKFKGDSTILKEACCEKCLKNTDIMSFSEKKRQPDIVNPVTIDNGLNPRSKMDGSDEFLDHGIKNEKSSEMTETRDEISSSGSKTARNTQANGYIAKSNFRNKTFKSKSIYIDVFKELPKAVDCSTSSTNDCTASDVVSKLGTVGKSPIFDSKLNGSITQDDIAQGPISESTNVQKGVRVKSYKSWRSNKVPFHCTECSQGFKSNRYDSGRFKEHRYTRQFRRSDKPKVFNPDSNDEHAFKTLPAMENKENETKESRDSSNGSFVCKDLDTVQDDAIHIDYHSANTTENNKENRHEQGLVSDDLKLPSLDLSCIEADSSILISDSQVCLGIPSYKRSDDREKSVQSNYEITNDSILCTISKSQNQLLVKPVDICEGSADLIEVKGVTSDKNLYM